MKRELLPKQLNDFIDYLNAVRNLGEKTINSYVSDIHMFLSYVHMTNKGEEVNEDCTLTNVDIHRLHSSFYSKITVKHIYNFLIYLDKRGNIATSKNRRLISIRNFLKFLKNTGFVKENVTDRIELAKVEHKEMKHLTLEQMKIILNAINSQGEYRFKIRDYAVMLILMNTGLRNAELREIRISNIDFKNQKLYVIGKGKKKRKIPLNESVINAINDWLKVRATITDIKAEYKDYLFINQKRTYMHKDNLRNIIRRYYKMTGIDVEQYHVHTIRHGALTIMMKNSGNVKAVQKISGHSSARTLLDIYIHTEDTELKDIVNNLGIV